MQNFYNAFINKAGELWKTDSQVLGMKTPSTSYYIEDKLQQNVTA